MSHIDAFAYPRYIPAMHTHRRLLLVRVIMALVCLGLAVPLRLTAAAGAISVETLALAPQTAPGFIEITAVAAQAELTCASDECVLSVRQTYVLHNRDQVANATVRVGLVGESTIPHTLSSADGIPLQAAEGTRQQWELTLTPNQSRTFWLDARHALGTAPFIRWRWDLSALRPWGTLVSARAALQLPAPITDEALLDALPPPARFDGSLFIWEWEALAAPEPVELALYAPPAWARLRALEAGTDAYALARYRLELYAIAQAANLRLADPYPAAVADLLAAIAADPAHDEARLALADLYLARAEASPDAHLNYVTLATRQLETVRTRHPDDTALAQRLSALYYDAAQTASREGDPAGAIEYLRRGAQPTNGAAVQELTLRWAADLAQSGQVARAIEAMQGAVEPTLVDAFLHYAPPITQARTDVTQRPDGREVRYTLALYEPAASKARQRLTQLAQALSIAPGCQVELIAPEDSAQAELVLRTNVTTPHEWVAVRQDILTTLGPDPDLLAALLAAPWQGELTIYEARSRLLAAEWRFSQQIDLAPLQATYDREAQYAHWRLVELRSAPSQEPTDEQAQLQQRLGLAFLEDQARLWDQLPSASLWTYTTEPPAITGLERGQWLVHWGEARTLVVSQLAIAWGRVRWLGLGLSCLLCGALLLAALSRGRR